MLTADQIGFYEENGYLGLENVLAPEEIEELRQVTDDFVEQSRAVSENTEFFGLEPGHTAEAPRVRRVRSPVSQHPVYERMMRHEAILGLVAQLIGPNIRLNGDKLNMKSPGYGSPVEWHQDWAFYPHTNDSLLAVGVVMDDTLLENGCLLVIPGSHKGPLLSHHQDGVFVGAVTDQALPTSEAIPIELKAGGISIHHVRTLHASAANTSERARRMLFFEFSAGDAWPLMNFSTLAAYDDRLVAGEPTLEPRLEKVPVRIPLPAPAQLQSSIYDLQTQLKESKLK